MKRAQQVVVSILASLTLGLAVFSAHAQPGAAAGTGPGMMGSAGAGQHHGKGAAGHQDRMGQAQQGAQGHGQHGATAKGPTAGGCPMAAQHTAQAEHKH